MLVVEELETWLLAEVLNEESAPWLLAKELEEESES